MLMRPLLLSVTGTVRQYFNVLVFLHQSTILRQDNALL